MKLDEALTHVVTAARNTKMETLSKEAQDTVVKAIELVEKFMHEMDGVTEALVEGRIIVSNGRYLDEDEDDDANPSSPALYDEVEDRWQGLSPDGRATKWSYKTYDEAVEAAKDKNNLIVPIRALK